MQLAPPSPRTVGKSWHHGSLGPKLTDLISIQTKLRNRVDRSLGIALAYVSVTICAVLNRIRAESGFVRQDCYPHRADREIWASDVRIGCRDLLHRRNRKQKRTLDFAWASVEPISCDGTWSGTSSLL